MSLLGRMFGLEKRAATGGQVIASAYGLRGAGGALTPAQAEGVGAVQACVGLIRSTLSSLPVTLMQTTDRGREEAPASALGWRLLRRPTRFLSWPAFIGMAAGELLLRGNFLCVMEIDGSGRPSELRPVPWDNVLAVMLPTGRMAYDVTFANYPYGPAGPPRRYLQDQVMHVRLATADGVVGTSVLQRASGPLAEGAEIQSLALNNWRNGLRPSMVFLLDKFLPEAQRKRFIEETRDKLVGSINAGGWALLEGGMKTEALGLSSVDAELLGSRAFSVSEICRQFGVPEILLQMGNRSIADTQPFFSEFVTRAVTPLITAVEAEWQFSLLPDGQSMVIDTSGALRGHFSTVASGFSALVQSGIVTPNDARIAMGFSPIAGGDELRSTNVPSYPPDRVGLPSQAPKPGPRGTDPENVDTHQGHGRGNGKAALQ